jgi:hypothetical protein
MNDRRLAAASLLALGAALASEAAFAHAVSLPTIDVGGHRRMVAVPHTHAPAPATRVIHGAPRPTSHKKEKEGRNV